MPAFSPGYVTWNRPVQALLFLVFLKSEVHSPHSDRSWGWGQSLPSLLLLLLSTKWRCQWWCWVTPMQSGALLSRCKCVATKEFLAKVKKCYYGFSTAAAIPRFPPAPLASHNCSRSYLCANKGKNTKRRRFICVKYVCHKVVVLDKSEVAMIAF